MGNSDFEKSVIACADAADAVRHLGEQMKVLSRLINDEIDFISWFAKRCKRKRENENAPMKNRSKRVVEE